MVDHHERRSSSLEGIASIAAQVGVLASKGSPQGWIIVAVELARLARLAGAIAKAHEARAELARARMLQRPLATIGANYDDSVVATSGTEPARRVPPAAQVFPRSTRGIPPIHAGYRPQTGAYIAARATTRPND